MGYHNRPLRLDNHMPFGKHDGEQIEDLIDDQPGYMAWLVENEIIALDAEVIKKLEERKII